MKQWGRSGVFIVNFEQVSHIVFPSLTLNKSSRLGSYLFCLLVFVGFFLFAFFCFCILSFAIKILSQILMIIINILGRKIEIITFFSFTQLHLCELPLFIHSVRSFNSIKVIFALSKKIYFICHDESHLATCAWKTKVPGSIPAATYVQRWLSVVIARLMSNCLWSGWKWYWGVKEIPSPFPGSLVIREWLWKKTQAEKKNFLFHLEALFVLKIF